MIFKFEGGKEASGVTKSDMELLDATKQLEDSLEASQGNVRSSTWSRLLIHLGVASNSTLELKFGICSI